jgi:hypothetical protein
MRREAWLDATRQRWKANLAYLCAAVGVVALVASGVVGRERAAYAVATTILAFLSWYGLRFSVRCRVCDEFVMHALWRNTKNPISELNALSACPNCGARSNDEPLYK